MSNHACGNRSYDCSGEVCQDIAPREAPLRPDHHPLQHLHERTIAGGRGGDGAVVQPGKTNGAAVNRPQKDECQARVHEQVDKLVLMREKSRALSKPIRGDDGECEQE